MLLANRLSLVGDRQWQIWAVLHCESQVSFGNHVAVREFTMWSRMLKQQRGDHSRRILTPQGEPASSHVSYRSCVPHKLFFLLPFCVCVFGWHKSKSSEADCSLSVWSAWHDISYSLLGLLVVEEAIRAAICFWTHSIDWYREHPAPSACILRKMQQPQYIFYCWSRTHAPCWYSALILGTFISIQVFCL